MCRKAAWAEPAAEVTGVVSGSKQDVRIIIKFRSTNHVLIKELLQRQ